MSDPGAEQRPHTGVGINPGIHADHQALQQAAREQLAKLDVVDKIVLADAAPTQVETVRQTLL